MKLARSSALVAVLLASIAWAGCNALLGNENAEFVPGIGDGGDSSTDDAQDGGDDRTLEDANPCVNITSNPSHCGRCDHSCLGGACVASVCQPFVLATDAFGPRTVAVDATHLYWVNETTGDLWRVPLAGGPPQRLYDGPSNAASNDIVFRGNDVFIAVPIIDGGVLRCPKTGCGAGGGTFEIDKLDVPSSVAITPAGVLYFSETVSNGRIGRCTLPCTVPFEVVDPAESFPSRIDVSDGGVFWSALIPAALRGIEGTGTTQTIVNTQPVEDLIVTPDELYWLEPGTGPKAKLRDGGGATRSLRTVTTLSQHFALDETNAYFTLGATGAVFSCARFTGCGDAGTRISFTEENPAGIVVDDKAIYWVNTGASDAGQIMRVAK